MYFFRTFEDMQNYMFYYYVNTLTRASPFFVGLIIGYVMHLYRGKTVNLTVVSIYLLAY